MFCRGRPTTRGVLCSRPVSGLASKKTRDESLRPHEYYLQILALGMRECDRVIRRVSPLRDHLRNPARVRCCGCDDGAEVGARQMLRARRGDQQAAGFEPTECVQVHVLVAAQAGPEVAPPAHERGRIEHDEIPALVAGAQEFEDILRDEAAVRRKRVRRPRGLDESTETTSRALPRPAAIANAPVYANAFSTRRARARPRSRVRVARWSRKNPVFWPCSRSTMKCAPSSTIEIRAGGSSPARTPRAPAMPSSARTPPSLRS